MDFHAKLVSKEAIMFWSILGVNVKNVNLNLIENASRDYSICRFLRKMCLFVGEAVFPAVRRADFLGGPFFLEWGGHAVSKEYPLNRVGIHFQ